MPMLINAGKGLFIGGVYPREHAVLVQDRAARRDIEEFKVPALRPVNVFKLLT